LWEAGRPASLAKAGLRELMKELLPLCGVRGKEFEKGDADDCKELQIMFDIPAQ
jgi:hypothetical protein